MLSFIGKIVTQLREEQDISIETLAERTGVTVAKLADIEKGAITPSVGVMIKISRALGSRLGTLLDGQESSGAVVWRASDAKPVENAAHNPIAKGGSARHMEFFSMAQGKKDRSMEPLLVIVQPATGIEELKSEHEGEEFLYVLDGEVEVIYGNEKHHLSTGDSIIYDSIVPHVIVSAKDTPAKILAVVYTPY